MYQNKKLYRSLAFMLIFLLFSSLVGEAAELVKKQDIVEVEYYKVQSTDTLWSISNKYEILLSDLKKFNQLESDFIKQGLDLKIPHFKTLSLVRVEKKDTLWSISQTYNTTVENIKQSNVLQDNIIYPGQHLVIIKKNPEVFYLESELPTKEEVFVSWKENYWIIEALTDLAQNDETKDHVQEEMTQKDNISRLELAVILEKIVHELQEENLADKDRSQEQSETEVSKSSGDSKVRDEDEIPIIDIVENSGQGLSAEDTKKLKRLIEFLEQELTEMNIKVENLSDKTKLLDNKTKSLETEVKEVETDVKTVDKKVEVIGSDLQQEKQITEETTQFKLEGLIGLKFQTSEVGMLTEKKLNQIILFNIHSCLNQTKEMDFFLQALYDHYNNQGKTEIIIGSSGKFGSSMDNYLSVDFIHQQPFNANIGYKQTYFGLGWSLYSPKIDLEALSGHSNTKDGQNSLSSFNTTIKGRKVKFNFKYKQHDPYFIPMNVGEGIIPGERYFPGENFNFLTFSEKRISGIVIYALTDVVEFKGGLLKDNDYMGKDIGFNIHNNYWDWKNDYIIWDQESPRDTSFWSSLGYIMGPVEVIVKFDYTTGDLDYTTVRTIGNINLTDSVAVNIEYNVIDEISTSSIFGIAYRF